MELRAGRPPDIQHIQTEPLRNFQEESMVSFLDVIQRELRTNSDRDFYAYRPPAGRITFLAFSYADQIRLTISLTRQERQGRVRGSCFDISLSATWLDDTRQEIGLIQAIYYGDSFNTASVVWPYAGTIDRRLWLQCWGIDEFAGADMGCPATSYHLHRMQALAEPMYVDAVGIHSIGAYLRKTRAPDNTHAT
jgi:hypothetical protein